jgi:hypothetical protein
MPERKQSPSETLMIRLARVAGSVAGTLAAKTAKVVARTESSNAERRKQVFRKAACPREARSHHGEEKGKTYGAKTETEADQGRLRPRLRISLKTVHQVLELGAPEMQEERTCCSFQVVIGRQALYAGTLSKIGDVGRRQQPCAFQSKYQP